MNTLKDIFADEVGRLMNRLEEKSYLKGVVFISGKPDSFIAGADINMINDCETAADTESLARKGQAMFDRIEQLYVPVVAAIHGACLGGGLELAMACHVRGVPTVIKRHWGYQRATWLIARFVEYSVYRHWSACSKVSL